MFHTFHASNIIFCYFECLVTILILYRRAFLYRLCYRASVKQGFPARAAFCLGAVRDSTRTGAIHCSGNALYQLYGYVISVNVTALSSPILYFGTFFCVETKLTSSGYASPGDGAQKQKEQYECEE